jgi:hypothetical protein
MKKGPTVGALIVGLGALGLLINRWIRGDVGWVMVTVIGVVVSAVVIVAVLTLVGKKSDGLAASIQAGGDWPMTVPGYVSTINWAHPGEVLNGRKMVLAAGPAGIAVFDGKAAPARQLLALAWPEIGQLQVGSAALMGQAQPAIVAETARGVLHLMVLTDKTMGIANTSVEGTTALLNQLQAVRVG